MAEKAERGDEALAVAFFYDGAANFVPPDHKKVRLDEICS